MQIVSLLKYAEGWRNSRTEYKIMLGDFFKFSSAQADKTCPSMADGGIVYTIWGGEATEARARFWPDEACQCLMKNR